MGTDKNIKLHIVTDIKVQQPNITNIIEIKMEILHKRKY